MPASGPKPCTMFTTPAENISANFFKFSSIICATLFSMVSLSSVEVLSHDSFVALSISYFWKRGYLAIKELSIGEWLSKYSPPTAVKNLPLIKFSYFSLIFFCKRYIFFNYIPLNIYLINFIALYKIYTDLFFHMIPSIFKISKKYNYSFFPAIRRSANCFYVITIIANNIAAYKYTFHQYYNRRAC